jgi:hypothetical protein
MFQGVYVTFLKQLDAGGMAMMLRKACILGKLAATSVELLAGSFLAEAETAQVSIEATLPPDNQMLWRQFLISTSLMTVSALSKTLPVAQRQRHRAILASLPVHSLGL